MKELIKKILREYYNNFDEYDDFNLIDFNEGPSFDYNSLPNIITLYRILELDSPDDIKNINKIEPGSHYSMDKNNLIKTRNFRKGKYYVILTVKADKKLIDIKKTLKNNIEYPMEKEITLKNKGKGTKVISIEPIKINN